MKILIIEVINLSQWSDGNTYYKLCLLEKKILTFKAYIASSFRKKIIETIGGLSETPFQFMTAVSASGLTKPAEILNVTFCIV